MRREGTPILPRGRCRSRRRLTIRTPTWHRRPNRYRRPHPTPRWLLPATTHRLTRPIPFLRRRHPNREKSHRHRNSKSHRSSGPHRNHGRSMLRLPRPRLPLLRRPSDRRPSTKRLLHRRPLGRHRRYKRRRELPQDLLRSHVRRPHHQGHPSVRFRRRYVELRHSGSMPIHDKNSSPSCEIAPSLPGVQDRRDLL
jgi:hypothetical protein